MISDLRDLCVCFPALHVASDLSGDQRNQFRGLIKLADGVSSNTLHVFIRNNMSVEALKSTYMVNTLSLSKI